MRLEAIKRVLHDDGTGAVIFRVTVMELQEKYDFEARIIASKFNCQSVIYDKDHNVMAWKRYVDFNMDKRGWCAELVFLDPELAVEFMLEFGG